MKTWCNENKKFLVSILLLFGVNAFVYFFSKLFISNYHLIGLGIDDKIPFLQSFIYIYMSWYPFLIITYYFIYKKDRNTYQRLLITSIISLIITYIIFFVYPTTVIRPEVSSYNSLTTFITYVTFKADTPVNCFPSDHCLLCFLLIFTTIRCKNMNNKSKLFIIIYNILIIASTMLVKQHVVLDAVGAFIISSLVFYFISNLKIFDKFKKRLTF